MHDKMDEMSFISFVMKMKMSNVKVT